MSPDDTQPDSLSVEEALRILAALNQVGTAPRGDQIDLAMRMEAKGARVLLDLLEDLVNQMKQLVAQIEELDANLAEYDALCNESYVVFADLGDKGEVYFKAQRDQVDQETLDSLSKIYWDAVEKYNDVDGRAQKLAWDRREDTRKRRTLRDKLHQLSMQQEEVLLKLGIIINPDAGERMDFEDM